MKKSGQDEQTTAQLLAQRKTLQTVQWVLVVLIVLYLIYFVVKLATGTWSSNSALGSMALGSVVVASALLTGRISALDRKIKERQKSE